MHGRISVKKLEIFPSTYVLLQTHALYQYVSYEWYEKKLQVKIILLQKHKKKTVLRRLKSDHRVPGARVSKEKMQSFDVVWPDCYAYHLILHDMTAMHTRTGTSGLTSIQSFQLLVLWGLASTQSFQLLVLQGLARIQSHQRLVLQGLASARNLSFGTPGTR